jgi:hypothetical protein
VGSAPERRNQHRADEQKGGEVPDNEAYRIGNHGGVLRGNPQDTTQARSFECSSLISSIESANLAITSSTLKLRPSSSIGVSLPGHSQTDSDVGDGLTTAGNARQTAHWPRVKGAGLGSGLRY